MKKAGERPWSLARHLEAWPDVKELPSWKWYGMIINSNDLRCSPSWDSHSVRCLSPSGSQWVSILVQTCIIAQVAVMDQTYILRTLFKPIHSPTAVKNIFQAFSKITLTNSFRAVSPFLSEKWKGIKWCVLLSYRTSRVLDVRNLPPPFHRIQQNFTKSH